MGSIGEYYNKFLDYLGWLYTRWWFWPLFIIDILIRLPYGNFENTHWIVYFIHVLDALILVTIFLSVIVGLVKLHKYAKRKDKQKKEKKK